MCFVSLPLFVFILNPNGLSPLAHSDSKLNRKLNLNKKNLGFVPWVWFERIIQVFPLKKPVRLPALWPALLSIGLYLHYNIYFTLRMLTFRAQKRRFQIDRVSDRATLSAFILCTYCGSAILKTWPQYFNHPPDWLAVLQSTHQTCRRKQEAYTAFILWRCLNPAQALNWVIPVSIYNTFAALSFEKTVLLRTRRCVYM
jgi:hypothetical protein